MATNLTADAGSMHVPQPERPRDAAAPRSRWGMVVLLLLGGGGVVAAALMLPEQTSRNVLGDVSTHTIESGDLLVTVTEQGTLESSNNTEIKCQVRGDNTIIWVVESGTVVEPGDELLRLETLVIDEEISERTKFSYLAQAAVARSAADVARAKIAIEEYLQGRYVSEMATLEKNLAIAKSNLLSAKNMRSHSKMMAESEYASELEVEEREFAVAQADLAVKLTETNIDVLKKFTKKEELATLKGALDSAKATHEANVERAYADEERLKRAKEELGHCIIKAPRSGMVLYPKANEWENVPDIEEGATVHKDQVLLLMPDLSQMQVKVGIHESMVDRVQLGMQAKVTLPGKNLSGEITYVSPVAKPAGWWSGNIVKYDSLVQLSSAENLKPGMSVEVEVILAEHNDVLLVPTSAVLETSDGHLCWVWKDKVAERRTLKLGDSSDMFIVVEEGLAAGEEVVLDPLASIREAQDEAAKMLDAERAAELSDI